MPIGSAVRVPVDQIREDLRRRFQPHVLPPHCVVRAAVGRKAAPRLAQRGDWNSGAPQSAIRFCTDSRRKEHLRLRPPAVSPRPRRVPVRRPNRAAVFQVIAQTGCAPPTARSVARQYPRTRWAQKRSSELIVAIRRNTVIKAELLRERDIARRCQPDHLHIARAPSAAGPPHTTSSPMRWRRSPASRRNSPLSARKSSIRNDVMNSGRNNTCNASVSGA